MQPEERATNRLAGQSAWGLVGEVVLVGGGLVNFVALTQLLTKGDYGLVTSVQGIAAPAYALAAMGSPFLLMRSIARGDGLQRAWSSALTAVLAGSTVVSFLLALLQPILLGPAELVPFVLLLVSTGALVVYQELFFAVSMGLERIQLGVLSRLIGTAGRLVALLAFGLGSDHTFERWAVFIVAGNAVAAVLITGVVGRSFGVSFRLTHPGVWFGNARDGYGFAMNGVSEGVLDASDRPILTNTVGETTAGEYGAAARLVTFSFIPVMAIMRAVTAELLREGVHGVSGPLRVTRRLVPMVAGIGVVVAMLTWLCAPVVPLLLGSKWDESVTILRWLSIVPAIKALQFLAGNALDAGQRQLVRFWLTMAAAALNLVLNLVFIPLYSWKAAVMTTIGAEAALTVALWASLVLLHRRQDHGVNRDEALSVAADAQSNRM